MLIRRTGRTHDAGEHSLLQAPAQSVCGEHLHLSDEPAPERGGQGNGSHQGGDKRAMVAEINVPESRVDERIMPLLKEITAYDTGEKEDADA